MDDLQWMFHLPSHTTNQPIRPHVFNLFAAAAAASFVRVRALLSPAFDWSGAGAVVVEQLARKTERERGGAYGNTNGGRCGAE